MSDHVKVRINPNLKAEVLKAAEAKLGVKIASEKDALRALAQGHRLSNPVLAHLSAKGLIEVDDITTLDTPPGERALFFTLITERGRRVLEE